MRKKFQKAGLMKMNDLELNKELYERKDIALVANIFFKLAVIKIEEDNNYWKCKFENCKYDIEQTKQEFENYLIDYVNSKGRRNDYL